MDLHLTITDGKVSNECMSFLCSILSTIVFPVVLFLLAIVLAVLRIVASG